MNLPAGWYDDGSGRQRWWDGQKWTGQVGAEGSVPQTSPQSLNGSRATAMSGRATPVLGFLGLVLALIGTVLACIPATFIVGLVVLIAAVVLSLIGLFKKKAAKWPSIVGMALAVLGGGIGAVVVVVLLASNAAGDAVSVAPPSAPPPMTSGQPTTPATDDSNEGRPSSEKIAELLGDNARGGGITGYESMPEFWPCMGEELYVSDISNESLWSIIRGGDPVDDEREMAEEALRAAIRVCDPDGRGAWG